MQRYSGLMLGKSSETMFDICVLDQRERVGNVAGKGETWTSEICGIM